MLPFTGGMGLPAEGRGGKGCRAPPRSGGRGGREVVAAALRAPMHRQNGGTGLAEQPYHGRKIHVIKS